MYVRVITRQSTDILDTSVQTAGWINMALGTEIGLGPGDCVRWGPSYPRKTGTPMHPHPIFGPGLLWPNGWMDQDATWYGGKRRPRRRCVRWGHSTFLKGAQPPVFGSCLLWPNGWMDEDAIWYRCRPRPRPHCIRRDPSSSRKGHGSPPPSFRPMSTVATVTHLS